jgi:hypothetical protein
MNVHLAQRVRAELLPPSAQLRRNDEPGYFRKLWSGYPHSGNVPDMHCSIGAVACYPSEARLSRGLRAVDMVRMCGKYLARFRKR